MDQFFRYKSKAAKFYVCCWNWAQRCSWYELIWDFLRTHHVATQEEAAITLRLANIIISAVFMKVLGMFQSAVRATETGEMGRTVNSLVGWKLFDRSGFVNICRMPLNGTSKVTHKHQKKNAKDPCHRWTVVVRRWDGEIFVLASLWQVPLDEVAEARQSVGCFEDAAL